MTQVVAVSSINANTGKTLLSAHLAIMLCKDYQTGVFDSAGDNSPMAVFIARRYNLNLTQNTQLVVPQYHTLSKADFKEKAEKCDVVLLDSPDAKFLSEADVLITPVVGAEGIAALQRADTMYAQLIWDAKKRRAAAGKNAFRWVVVPNDDFTAEDIQSLLKISRFSGFEVAPRFPHRNDFAQGLKTGITVLDKDNQNLKSLFSMPDLYARRDLKKLADFIWRNK